MPMLDPGACLPKEFLLRMERLLGEDFPSYYRAMQEAPKHALRVVLKKGSAEAVRALLPFETAPLPFSKTAFSFPDGIKVGALGVHHAGMIYVQEPSAMAPVSALPFSIEGFSVLDLCASPGGKSGQLSEAIGPSGFLLSNEPVLSRARILAGNLERLGCENVAVSSLYPDRVAALYPECFRLTVVDAPCSGEGMFRKLPQAVAEWSEAAVAASAARQREILAHAAKTVAPGGYLLYSTCTFSVEENEENVIHFLKTHPDFHLLPLRAEVAACGTPALPSAELFELSACARRFYPHASPGEGQFCALLEREGGAPPKAPSSRARQELRKSAKKPSPDEKWGRAAVPAEARELLDSLLTLPEGYALFDDGTHIYARRETVSLSAEGLLCPGVALLERKGRIFVPHHHLFSCFGARLVRRVRLEADDERLTAYLRGETFALAEEEILCEGGAEREGFASLLLGDAPLGGIKITGLVAKNHYPKGLRLVGRA